MEFQPEILQVNEKYLNVDFMGKKWELGFEIKLTPSNNDVNIFFDVDILTVT